MIELFAKELVKPIVSSIIQFIKDDTMAQEYTENMQRILMANYKDRSNIKNILHSTSPVPFKDIYSPLKLSMMSSSGFEHDYGAQKVESVGTLLKTFNNIAIFGNAGCGKSTLVNFLYLNAIEECYKYPILIPLRYLNETTDSLIRYLRQQTLGLKDIGKADELFVNLLEEGRFLFFFDGYDEVTPTKQYSLSIQINELISQYPQNKYVLTSRPLEQLYALKSFHNFVVAPLNKLDREEFIRKQFPDDRQKIAETIIRKISENPNNQYDQILNTPLLVILCILNFQLNSDLPIRRTEFYSRIFDALFQGHDWRSKTGFERERKCKLSKDGYIDMLSKFSFITLFKSMVSFKKPEALYVLKRVTGNDKKDRYEREIDEDELFEDLSVAINIIVSDGNYYSFPHKSFQEYYAASYVYSKDEDKRKKIYEKFVNRFFDKDGSLLSLSLLSMLYEMDQKLFLKGFIIPILDIAKTSITNKLYDLGIERVENLLAIVNVMFYGQDDNVTRELFAVGKIDSHLTEVNKLIEYAEEQLRRTYDEDDFLCEILN